MKDTTSLSVKPITSMPVVRDENGYWTHPEVAGLYAGGYGNFAPRGSCLTG